VQPTCNQRFIQYRAVLFQEALTELFPLKEELYTISDLLTAEIDATG
jgi:hypothetical protein